MGLLKSQSLSTIQDIAYRDPIISTQFIDKNEIFLLQHTYFQLWSYSKAFFHMNSGMC
jgi:hypothetical protein